MDKTKQESQSFDDQAPAKVGAIGEDIVKNYLQSHSYRVEKPKDVFPSGASTVDFECWDKNNFHFFAEVKTYRQTKFNNEMTFKVQTAKWEKYRAYQIKYGVPVLFFIVDTSPYHYSVDNTNRPAIWKTTLDRLAEYESYKVYTSAHNQLYKDGYIHFPIDKKYKLFDIVDYLTDYEIQQVVEAQKVMDDSPKEENKNQKSSNNKQPNDTTPSEDESNTTTSNSFEILAERLNKLPKDVCLSIIFNNEHFRHIINLIIDMTRSFAPHFTQNDPLVIITKHWAQVLGLDKEFNWIFDVIDVARETTPPHKNQSKETKNNE